MLRACIVLFAAVFSLGIESQTRTQAAETGLGIPILVYHRFGVTSPGLTTVRTSTFEQQLDWLQAHRYRVVTLRSVIEDLPHATGPAVVLTVDDGHSSVYSQLFPIIRRRHLPVTLFIYPSAISRASYALTWGQLLEMQRSGLVDVQSHTYWHPDFRQERAHRSPEDYRNFVAMQLARSKSVLERHLGTAIDMLAWPYGIFDTDLKAAAAQAGYIAAFAYAGGLAHPEDDRFAIPRIPVSDHAQGAAFPALLEQGSPSGRPHP